MPKLNNWAIIRFDGRVDNLPETIKDIWSALEHIYTSGSQSTGEMQAKHLLHNGDIVNLGKTPYSFAFEYMEARRRKVEAAVQEAREAVRNDEIIRIEAYLKA